MKFYYDFLDKLSGKEKFRKALLKAPWLLDMVVSRAAPVASLALSGCLVVFPKFQMEFVPKPPPGISRRSSGGIPAEGKPKEEEALPPLAQGKKVRFAGKPTFIKRLSSDSLDGGKLRRIRSLLRKESSTSSLLPAIPGVPEDQKQPLTCQLQGQAETDSQEDLGQAPGNQTPAAPSRPRWPLNGQRQLLPAPGGISPDAGSTETEARQDGSGAEDSGAGGPDDGPGMKEPRARRWGKAAYGVVKGEVEEGFEQHCAGMIGWQELGSGTAARLAALQLSLEVEDVAVKEEVTAIVTAIELEGAFKGHLVQQPRNKEGHRSSSRLSRAWSSLALKGSPCSNPAFPAEPCRKELLAPTEKPPSHPPTAKPHGRTVSQ
ncbi:uncharacterized protein LOC121108780 isoform X1 [Gallus gallus]|uniref:uncharacterized protein LOC121108780 isoform X1 n=1 Tax=Gallus gallus TaxID=9031 RepID=UPI001AE4AFD3|nr:uncharacterized protein LOC121108780 isoform X1 [Gallus gallus]